MRTRKAQQQKPSGGVVFANVWCGCTKTNGDHETCTGTRGLKRRKFGLSVLPRSITVFCSTPNRVLAKFMALFPPQISFSGKTVCGSVLTHSAWTFTMSSPGTIRIISLCVSMHCSVHLKRKRKKRKKKKKKKKKKVSVKTLFLDLLFLFLTRGVFDISDHFAVLKLLFSRC